MIMAENRKLEISDFLAEVLYYRPDDRAAIRHVLDEFGQLERALDKACEKLQELSGYNVMYANGEIYHQTGKSKEEWKEWLLKNG